MVTANEPVVPEPEQIPAANQPGGSTWSPPQLAREYGRVRDRTEALAAGLSPEDQNLQSMPEASPVKWHRAHTTWFFETFVLAEFAGGHEWYEPAFCELFNSYYNGVGRQHPRPKRALISRPDAGQVSRYRRRVDEQVLDLLEGIDEPGFRRLAPLMVLGIHHEQQHQELILTDTKHAFSFNPLAPAMGHRPETGGDRPPALDWIRFDAGEVSIGHAGQDFCFDNETPRHRVVLNNPYALASRPVSCGEFLEFMAEGGYGNPLLWLSDGWAWVQENRVCAPLYWRRDDDGQWQVFTLAGWHELNPHEPACHLNYYEACAFAEWTGYRLPTEAEWEAAAAVEAETGIAEGHFADRDRFHPEPQAAGRARLAQCFGSVWEWTTSAYGPYPGFRAAPGAVGEYNGKFMANQMVLRGGSCATPAGHIRPSYRNFFYPADRWQFTGLRLARDLP